jgi:adenylate cyclase class IV
MTESYENVEKSRKILFQFLEKFGVKKEESIRKSYLELIADKLFKK